jgi:hypothetical protein
MLALSGDEQAKVLTGTDWDPPGVCPLDLAYPPGTREPNGAYRSGPLEVTRLEYRSHG